MRVAVLLEDRCQPKKCNQECIFFCPVVRAGTDCIKMGEEGKPVVYEDLCIGCGICVNKCPFDALRIEGLPDEMMKDVIHRYGMNSFRLYGLPVPRTDKVVGILGSNGIGKTTAISILSGNVVPNFGNYEAQGDRDATIEFFRGTALKEYFEKLYGGKIRAAVKPQYVDSMPKTFSGEAGELLKRVDERGNLGQLVGDLGLKNAMDRKISHLSGGELQKVAVAATFCKDADVYLIDEPSSYLDISERLELASLIRREAENRRVVVVEHDLAIFDFISDNVYILYGVYGAYGIVSNEMGARTAINAYLDGRIREDNIRFRDYAIDFQRRSPDRTSEYTPVLSYTHLSKEFSGFSVDIAAGVVGRGEVIGVLGPNATGKTTFIRMLAGAEKPDRGSIDGKMTVSYKPQYISAESGATVEEVLSSAGGERMRQQFYVSEVMEPMELRHLMDKKVDSLSGGELQRVAISLCLLRDADVYLIDEPSAYLDSAQRMNTSRMIRRVIENSKKSAFIVEHDIYFIDLVADRLMVFSGESGVSGGGSEPMGMKDGMNAFLKSMDITFRRDGSTARPRINKLGSRLDREQKGSGAYYYDE